MSVTFEEAQIGIDLGGHELASEALIGHSVVSVGTVDSVLTLQMDDGGEVTISADICGNLNVEVARDA